MIVVILGGIFMLAVCIFIHELGHFLMGRLVGIRAQIFSIGYGRGVWKKRIGETTYQITAIPLGGYVKFYGDDYFEPDHAPGGLLSAAPWRRIVAVLGGPFFNLLLGLVVFFLLHTFSGPLSPRIFISEEGGQDTPAYRDGLRNGDLVLSLNGEAVKDFYDLQQNIILSGGAELRFRVKRGEEEKEMIVHPRVDQAGRAFVGIRTPGQRFLEVNYPFKDLWAYRFFSLFPSSDGPPRRLRALPYLHQGDVILKVQDFEPHSIQELQLFLGKFNGNPVELTVKRETLPWLAPWFHAETKVTIPTSAEFKVILSGLFDVKYGEKIPDQEILSYVTEHEKGLYDIKINGQPPGSFEDLYRKFSEKSSAEISFNGRDYTAEVVVEKIGLLGFQPNNVIVREYQRPSGSFTEIASTSLKDTWENIMVYPSFFKSLVSGRLSFIDNAMGPVGMFAVAGVVFKYGFIDYMHMLATISIALMVMNLLPFPVVDGGHIVFFLIEAVAGRPVSPIVMEAVNRVGFSILLFLGLWIMYRDFLFLIGL